MVEKYKIDETNHCGTCPECEASWDNGEVVDYLMNGELYLGATSDRDIAENTARRSYGWTPENKKRISKLAFVENSDGHDTFNGLDGYYQCPQCQVAWGSENGERTEKFKSLLAEKSAMDEFLKNKFPKHYKR
jgi:Zn-finger nucleic acid-binding protein